MILKSAPRFAKKNICLLIKATNQTFENQTRNTQVKRKANLTKTVIVIAKVLPSLLGC